MAKDDIIYTDPINDCHRWSDFELRAIHRFMEEYAKQQAIAFIKRAIQSALCGDNYGGVFIINEKETEESLYSQFIEQQNKE